MKNFNLNGWKTALMILTNLLTDLLTLIAQQSRDASAFKNSKTESSMYQSPLKNLTMACNFVTTNQSSFLLKILKLSRFSIPYKL